MKVAGIAFAETLISLEAADFKSRLLALSSAGKVPVLIDGDVRIWESLVILEYLVEKIPAAGLWPQDPAARAHARAVASEMHAGFQALRRLLPMNVSRSPMPRALDADARADVARIEAIWSECRARLMPAALFFMAHSARPTPCMRRSSGAFTPTLLRSMLWRAPICVRSWHCRRGTNGVTRHGVSLGCSRMTKSIGRRSDGRNSREGAYPLPPVQSGRQQEYVLPRRGHDFLPPFAGGCFN